MKALALAPKALLALIVAFITLAFTVQQAPAQTSARTMAANNATKAALLKEMNAVRRAHRRAPLRMNAVLSRPALAHSRYLATLGELQHEGADGKPFWVRIYRAGYSKRKAIGENLGMIGGCSGVSDHKTMVQMWLESPGHRRNLLAKEFKHVGIAIVSSGDCANTVYATDFGG